MQSASMKFISIDWSGKKEKPTKYLMAGAKLQANQAQNDSRCQTKCRECLFEQLTLQSVPSIKIRNEE